jgi:diaminobutyrate-2-oxoglutarate transaminase
MKNPKTAFSAVMTDDIRAFRNLNALPGEFRNPSTNKNCQDFLAFQAETESNARSYPRKLPFALEQAKGVYIKDVDGNVYYDCLAGAGAIALGHNHRVVQEAMMEQIQNNLPMLTLDITTPVKQDFVKEILSLFPEEFAKNAKVQFCGPSGADAVEAAIKLVKIATGRRSMVAFHGAYHGMTHGALSLMGNLGSKSQITGLMPDVYFLPYPYKYRSAIAYQNEEEFVRNSINHIETVLTDDESGIPKPAGIIVEAVQGEGGKIPAPDAWLRELRRITKEQGIPLILDEIQTGIGRTGKMFAFEHSGIIPDVVLLSKAVGGTLPMSVVVYHKDLDKWGPGSHAGTFRGNQLGMATGAATIKFIKQKHLHEHAAEMGEIFMNNLTRIQTETYCIGDVRGRGLMIGVEIVNKTSGVLQNGNPERYEKLARRIQFECFCRGLIIEIGGRQSSVLRFMPPLIITENQINHICEIFKDAVIAAEKMLLLQEVVHN